MDDRSQAELNILIAADRWAREVMRADKVLNPVDQALWMQFFTTNVFPVG